MRSSRLFAHDPKGIIPRMSWSPHNLYNLIARSMPLYAAGASFRKTNMTMYEQRWRSKRLLRGYHGDWIRERNFKRWYLPIDLPQLRSSTNSNAIMGTEASGEERMPVSSLFLREVERRVDTVIFRCCFARSAREARALVVQGKVHINGQLIKLPGTLLNPGDLISIEPKAVPMLGKDLQKLAEMREAAELAAGQEVEEIAETTDTAETPEMNASTEADSVDNTTKLDVKSAEGDESVVAEVSEGGEGSDAAATDSVDKVESSKIAVQPGQRSEKKLRAKEVLAPGVLPFNLPPFAAPFLFIPPFLEVSFNTCSAIYLRHPTITPVKTQTSTLQNTLSSSAGRRGAVPSISYKTDMPSPYPAGGELYSLAWEHYIKNAPRTRSDLRRLQLDAKVGRDGFKSARAKDQYKKVRAVRRGHDKISSSQSPIIVAAIGKRVTGKASRSGRFMEKGQARGKGVSPQLRA